MEAQTWHAIVDRIKAVARRGCGGSVTRRLRQASGPLPLPAAVARLRAPARRRRAARCMLCCRRACCGAMVTGGGAARAGAVTLGAALARHADLLGPVNRAALQALAAFAGGAEAARLRRLVSPDGAAEYKAWHCQSRCLLEVLEEFPGVRPPLGAPRLLSLHSLPLPHPLEADAPLLRCCLAVPARCNGAGGAGGRGLDGKRLTRASATGLHARATGCW